MTNSSSDTSDGIGSTSINSVQHRTVAAKMDGVGQNVDGRGADSASSTTGSSPSTSSGTAAAAAELAAGTKDTAGTYRYLGSVDGAATAAASAANGNTRTSRGKAKVTPPATPPATRQPSFAQEEQESAGGHYYSDGDDGDDDHDDHDVLHDVPVDHHAAAAHEEQDGGEDDSSLDRLMDLDASSSYTVKTSNMRSDGGINTSNNTNCAAAAVVAGSSSRPRASTGSSSSNKPQTFDIEMSGPDSPDSYDDDGYDDDDDDDSEQHPSTKQAVCCLSTYCCPCLPPCYRIGNTTVVIPPLYERTGKYGVIGPHWPGLVATLGLLGGASYYYITQAFRIGPISGGVCVLMTTICTILLFGVALCDPGMITALGSQRQHRSGRGSGVAAGGGEYAGLPTDGRDLSDWRYCDLCAVYQPPDAAHCPDCQVCVEGYDHHCPWMGTCIGKRNMKAFVLFNLSWLCYLFYAVGWVTFGPLVTGAADFGDGAGGGSNSTASDTGGDTFA